MKNIAFIGFGAFGQALAGVLEKKEGIELSAWDVQDTGKSCQVPEVADAVKDAEVIFFAVPSQFFVQCVSKISSIPDSAILVTGTKGMDPETNKLPFEILQAQFPKNKIAVLSGPMLADELNEGLPTTATIASDKIEVANSIKKLFEGTQVSLQETDDMIGAALLGVLKNVYVLALGISDGLKMGSDFKASLIQKAQVEMQEILHRLGAHRETISTPAGMGDFLATGYSSSSRNYSYGFGFATGNTESEKTVEGMKNIQNIMARLENGSDLPFLSAVKAIFKEGADARKTLESVIK
ncbi:hypothetical protein HN358_00250 [Candidatus Uhrbacteria bacterium]|jgi:glycerol-3-phosphate dehydrogenase (NAD(P)+)|nr:hypothetical protein [Candidatus Uhrbacteria bacterium]MBT7717280.1 hypothetical protein [Candidatus Uhrbacteria bacterium]